MDFGARIENAKKAYEKAYAALEAKHRKQVEANAQLKQQIADMKASHSRVRRIPKKAQRAPTEAPEPAEPHAA